MKFKTKLILSFLVISGITGFLGISSIYQLTIIEKSTQIIPEKIEEINLSSEIDSHAQFIRYYDEVLTQSARNYAFTQEELWADRYRQYEPLLDAEINHAAEDDESITQLFKEIDVANRKLVAMEYQSIELVNQGNAQEAINILQSQEYWDNKALYEQALRTYIENKGIEYLDVLTTDTADIEESIDDVSKSIFSATLTLSIIIPIIIAVSIAFGITISHSVSNPISKLIHAIDEIKKGNLDFKLKPEGSEEHRYLIAAFGDMVESLKELNKKKRQFLTMISHELKTPLQPIQGNLEMLMEPDVLGKLNKDQLNSIDEIQKSTNRLQIGINDLLLVSEIILGKLDFQKETIKIKDLMDEVEKDSHLLISTKNFNFVNSTKDDFSLVTDNKKVKDVLFQLVQNAAEYNPAENGEIEINVEERDNEVIFYVKDNGVGISTQTQKELFKEFYQLDMSDTRKHQGLGLGLKICKGIVQGLGGKIWVESEEGKGSTFFFTIPKAD